MKQSAAVYGLGDLTRAVTFDVNTLEKLRGGPGSDEGKVFNLVRGLKREIDEEPDAAPVLQTLKDRADRILKDLENRNATGLAAMDMLAALAREKEEAIEAAKESGLAPRAFGVYWTLKDNDALRNAGVSAMEFSRGCGLPGFRHCARASTPARAESRQSLQSTDERACARLAKA